MAEFGNRYGRTATVGTRVGTHAVDEGLRSYMVRVYNYMALGVGFTAIVTLFVMNSPQLLMTIAGTPLKWVLFAGILGLGMFAPRLMLSGNTAMAHAGYWGYAALWGLLIAPMVYYFFRSGDGNLVFRALAITAVTFGGTSLYGYVTKRDLSAFASFFVMASIGLLVAIVLNALIFQDIGASLIISCLVVLLFSAVTAWETQAIKEMYVAGDEGAAGTGKAIFGAFMLYGSFVTLFVHILNILGIMSSD